ncbi:MAG: peptidoglycan bridge formation glycyltransferase FemA/FemB family protein [Sulfuricurvum sp.]|uniref:lipid II:glycine glycyltransferase FemX n=1 Tax=Sulfuricurvum sp. TaxID=2025608 RepID=UPI00262E6497|nr:GNAT family N-acetyltransferase [Sulfuricurvum sp.]MDD5158972.1 peptidoglycan bridge formation glycyltransferase FemA/FemB family protein [Sulfuricurvum sp.]
MKIIQTQTEITDPLPVLSSESYLSAKSSRYGWFVSEKFILPFFIDKRLIFKRMVFTYDLIPRVENTGVEDQQQFLDAMVEYCQKEKVCDFISKAQSNVVFATFPTKSTSVPWGTHEIDINKDDTELLLSFDGKHRNRIRKAIQEGAYVQTTTDINLVYRIIKETLSRQNSIHYPSLNYLETLQSKLKTHALFFTVQKDNQPQGAAVVIYDGVRGYAMYAGSIEKPSNGSINLMHYEIMKILRDQGTTVYDFVGARINVKPGTKYADIQKFKSHFGASLKEGYTFRVIINPLKYLLFNIVSQIYFKIKGIQYKDPIDQILSGKYK